MILERCDSRRVSLAGSANDVIVNDLQSCLLLGRSRMRPVPPTPLFLVSADSKEVAGVMSISADSA